MKNILFSTLFFLLGIGVNAQASFGFASSSTPGLADTVLMGSTVTYGVSVKNTGNQPFSGNYTVYVYLQDTSNMFLISIDSTNLQTPSLLAGDSAGVTITHTIDPLKFMDGNNTVVIWPASPTTGTTDSIIRNIFVITFQKTDELSINQLNIYPNPVSNYLIVRCESEVENVRILDLNGKELFITKNTHLDLSIYAEGTYIVEVKTKEGKFLRKKIILKK